MGALLGLFLGLGGALIGWALTDAEPAAPRVGLVRRGAERARRLLIEAGMSQTGVAGIVAWALTCAGVVFVVVAGVSRSPVLATAFACMAGYTPIAVVRSRRHRRRAALCASWPDVVDDLTSAVRAGLALPEALIQLGRRGPVELRPAFASFALDYRAGGRFNDSLDLLKDLLDDPVGDRVVEALRLTREVGGSDLGRLLRTLSQFLREDARTRGELEARQAWTINGARLAVAAPWALLALLATRPPAVAAYDTAAGAVVLVGGGMACAGAYRLMVRLGRLPTEERVLR
jgi:tight adherence protein B